MKKKTKKSTQTPKRLTAFLLAFCLLLPFGLTACGKKAKTEQISGKIYVPTFTELEIEGVDYIRQGCADNEYIYFSANVQGDEKEETWTDPDTGETEVYTYYDFRTGLFRVPLDGGDAVELENYALPEVPEGDEGQAYLANIEPGADGTLWVTEQISTFTYDLPEDFDEATDDKWMYQTDYQDTLIRRQIDSTGTELNRIDLSELEEKSGLEYVDYSAFDAAGNIYAVCDRKIAVLDQNLQKLFEVELAEGEERGGNFVLLGNGSVGTNVYYHDEEYTKYGYRLRTIDAEKQAWGEQSYELSPNSYSVYPGGGDYLFYCQNGDSVYGYKPGAPEGEKIFSWLTSGLDRSSIEFFTFLPDGRVAALVQEWREEIRTRVAVLTPTDPKDLPERTVLTLGTTWLSYDTKNKIIDFNENNTAYRIEVVDYSEYNTGENTNAGLTRLNTELAAGSAPDMFYVGGEIPLKRYAAKGFLEDLWPYIESDAEIGGREALMTHVLDAASIDGKLYQTFNSFTIQTVAGPKNIVGDRMSWTLSDLQSAHATMPEGCTVFGEEDTKEGMLWRVMSMNMDRFVDWEKGTCSFDSDSFKALLTFANSFPAEFDYENMDWENWRGEEERVAAGEQMLASSYLYGFTSTQLQDKLFPGGVSYVGYPREDGGVGSCFSLSGDTYAMSSVCKDKEGAWSFMRQAFLSRAEEVRSGSEMDRKYAAAGIVSNAQYRFGSYPVNKTDFELYKDSSMQEIYITDENGDPVLDENGEPMREAMDSYWLSGDDRIEVYSARQEDVDRIMALYEGIDSVYGYDDSIYEIIQDNVGAFFAGDRDVEYTAGQIQNRAQLYIGELM